MARPHKIVKNELSNTIAELRRRLSYSQQSWAHLLGLSIGAVARWELNSRPERQCLIRLFELANQNGHRDLADIIWREYRREHGLASEAYLAMDMGMRIRQALMLARSIEVPNAPAKMLRALETQKKILEGLDKQVLEILAEYDQLKKGKS
jgi:transcriptional regulator with XRE-family HTH domain